MSTSRASQRQRQEAAAMRGEEARGQPPCIAYGREEPRVLGMRPPASESVFKTSQRQSKSKTIRFHAPLTTLGCMDPTPIYVYCVSVPGTVSPNKSYPVA
eukprot:766195-Hanusia_phi.AAC.19